MGTNDLIWSEPNCYSFESTACDLVFAGLSLFYGNQKRDCFNVWSSYLLHTSGGIIFCQRSNSVASDAVLGIQLENSSSMEKRTIKNERRRRKKKVRFSFAVNINQVWRQNHVDGRSWLPDNNMLTRCSKKQRNTIWLVLALASFVI